jgi:ABC-type multidrug transport system fused ATPase/permease subunit
VEGLQGLFAETILNLIRDTLTLLVGITLMFWINWKLALISLGILPFFLLSITIFNKKIRELSKQQREAYANVYKNLQESLSGIGIVKAFVAEKYYLIKMIKTLKAAIRLDFRTDLWGTTGWYIRHSNKLPRTVSTDMVRVSGDSKGSSYYRGINCF